MAIRGRETSDEGKPHNGSLGGSRSIRDETGCPREADRPLSRVVIALDERNTRSVLEILKPLSGGLKRCLGENRRRQITNPSRAVVSSSRAAFLFPEDS